MAKLTKEETLDMESVYEEIESILGDGCFVVGVFVDEENRGAVMAKLKGSDPNRVKAIIAILAHAIVNIPELRFIYETAVQLANDPEQRENLAKIGEDAVHIKHSREFNLENNEDDKQ